MATHGHARYPADTPVVTTGAQGPLEASAAQHAPVHPSPYTENVGNTSETLGTDLTGATGATGLTGATGATLPYTSSLPRQHAGTTAATGAAYEVPPPAYDYAPPPPPSRMYDYAATPPPTAAPPPPPPPPAIAVAPSPEKPGKQPKMIDSRQVAHTRNKLILWLIWFALMVVSVVYVVIAFVTFGRVQYIQNNPSGRIGSRDLWGVLTATMITPILVVAFFVFGTFVLATKSVRETGFTYVFGLLHASAFWLAMLALQSAVTMEGYNAAAHDFWNSVPGFSWGSSDGSLYTATWVFAYVLACLYLILFLLLFLFRGSLNELHLEEEELGVAAGGQTHGKRGDMAV